MNFSYPKHYCQAKSNANLLKSNFLVLLVLVFGLFYPNPAKSVIFESQQQFEDYLLNSNCQLLDIVNEQNGVDFEFTGNIDYTIDEGVTVEVLEEVPGGDPEADELGVQLLFDIGAGLIVRGILRVNTDENGLPLSEQTPHFFGTEDAGVNRWDGIQIERDGNNGFGIFSRTIITGGSDLGVENLDFPNTRGQVTLTGTGDLQTPTLFMNQCELTRGRSHGIAIWGGTFAQLYSTRIHDIEVRFINGQRRQGQGIFLMPLDEAEENGAVGSIFSLLLNDCDIFNCNYGIYSHTILRDNEPPMLPCPTMHITNTTEIHHNWDTGIRFEGREQGPFIDYLIDSESKIYNNGVSGEGWGINIDLVSNSDINGGSPYVGPKSFIKVSGNAEINDNAWGGMRIWDTNMGITVDDAKIFQNGLGIDDWEPAPVNRNFTKGQGIKVRLWRNNGLNTVVGEGVQSWLNVLNSEIYNNGFQGISVSKGEDDPPAAGPIEGFYNDHTNIVGNHIYNNGQNCMNLPELVERDARRGSNVHILERLHHVCVTMNLIEGGVTGVCWDVTQNPEQIPEDRASANIVVRNNVITDALLFGFFSRRFYPDDPIQVEDFSSLVTNNVIWDNGKGQNTLLQTANARFDPIPAVYTPIQFESNIVGRSEDYNGNNNAVGLLYTGVWQPPFFDYNAFSNFPGDDVHDINGFLGPNFYPNSFVCADAGDLGLVSIADAQPSDYHLKWYSGLINLGRNTPNNADPASWIFPNWEYIPNSLNDADFVRPDNQQKRDGSRNDAGVLGNEWAEGIKFEVVPNNWGGENGFGDPFFDFWALNRPPPNLPPTLVYLGPPEDTHEMDPYCAIKPGYAELNRTFLGLAPLKDDYYRAYCNITTSDGQELDIGPNGQQDGAAYIEFAGNGTSLKWTVNGVLRANGDPDEGAEKKIFFAKYPGDTYWDRIYVYNPDNTCLFNGCDISQAQYPLRMYNPMTMPMRTVEVNNCAVSNASNHGITAYYNIQLFCRNSEVFDCVKNGIYLSDNQPNNQTEIINVAIHDCSISPSTAEGGIYCYDSNPAIQRCFIHDNNDHGIYITGEDSNPEIQCPANEANTICNNGNGAQADAEGAEIRIANANAMEEERRISGNNIWDVLNDNGNGIRRGMIVATVTNTDIFLDNGNLGNYYGDNLEAEYAEEEVEMEFADAFDPDVDLLATGVGVFVNDLGEENEFIVEDEMLLPNRLGDLLASARRPENAFEEGLFALKAGDLETARDRMRYWMTSEPGHPKASAAARILRRVECSLGADLGRLNREYIELAASTAGEHPRLSWTARKCAVKCLRYQGRLREAIDEYCELIEDAPDEIEALFIDTDRLLCQMELEGDEVNTTETKDIRIAANMERVEEIYAQRFAEKRNQIFPSEFELKTPYPNPFNSTTLISFYLPDAGLVKLSICDVTGRQVANCSKQFTSGLHSIVFKAEGIPSGVYFLKASSIGSIKIQKLMLIR